MLLIRGVLFLLLFGVIVSGPAEAASGVTVNSLTVSPTTAEAGQTVTFAATITATQKISNYPLEFSWFPVSAAASTATTAVVYVTLQANERTTETYIETVPADTAAGSYTLDVGSASTTFTITAATVTAVSGACGTVSGTDLTSAPTTDLCSAGTASVVTGTGPWTWTCAGSHGGTTASCHALVGGGLPSVLIPQLIQHVASAYLGPQQGLTGNAWKIPLPNPVQAGDILVLYLDYPHGDTVSSITDTIGNTWSTTPAVTADGGPGNALTAIYLMPDSGAGAETLTVNLSAGSGFFSYAISEYNNVATSSPSNGTLGTGNITVSGGSISPGSFTPTNNNSNGGNLLLTYVADAAQESTGTSTGFTAGTNFTLLDADRSALTTGAYPHATQAYLQGTSASITPSIGETGDTADTFNSVTVALKVAAGTGGSLPTGIDIHKILHFTTFTDASNQTVKLQVPVTGNLLVLSAPEDNFNFTSVTDSDGNTWHFIGDTTGSSQMWYTFPSSADPTLVVSVAIPGNPGNFSIRVHDIINATAYDTNGVNDGFSCVEGSDNPAAPDITPTHAPGLVIATNGFGTGPGRAVTAPSGAVWDFVTYTGETDLDTLENADGMGHLYNSTTAPESWTWTSTVGTSCYSVAGAFH